jgi:hypothetical protein
MSHPKARSTIQHFGQIQAAVEYDPMDLINFIKKNFVPLNLMMERAGMTVTRTGASSIGKNHSRRWDSGP